MKKSQNKKHEYTNFNICVVSLVTIKSWNMKVKKIIVPPFPLYVYSFYTHILMHI